MANYSIIQAEVEPIYGCAKEFLEKCLHNDDSLIFDDNVWTLDNLELIHERFNNQPDISDDSFLSKFNKQIGNESRSITRLAGELLVIYYLFPSSSNVLGDTKRSRVNTVLHWNGDTLPTDHMVFRALEYGIGGTGQGYLSYQYKELWYFINLSIAFKKLTIDVRKTLNDPWKFQEFVDTIPDAENRQGRHMLLHLLFPDDFERIATTSDKESIVHFFAKYANQEIDGTDRRLLSIRQALEAEYPGKDVDFYRSPWREGWHKNYNKASFEIPFKNWLAKEGHTPKTITAYSAALRLAPAKLQHVTISPINLLQCSNLAELRELYNQIRKAPNFEIVNQNQQSGSFSAGMAKYENFLELIFAQELTDALASLPLSQDDRFRIWLIVTKDWVENTVKQCISALQKTASKLEGFSNFDPNLFRFSKSVDFNSVFSALYAAPNFKEVDRKANNNSFSRGLKYYKIFLEQMGAASNGSDIQIEPRHDQSKIATYGINDIYNEGCFLSHEELSDMLERLLDKKNLILQGPPGTGKTWLAKRLAYALVGCKDKKYVHSIQFHATMSYEDFVLGWRPAGKGELKLSKGPFLKLMKEAEDFPNDTFVMVIEEINRGNPAQIFGELLTLLEADKRHAGEALWLCYQEEVGQDTLGTPVHIPDNIYVIGTMNTADRSLAMVDFALHRRFAFITLAPCFGDEWVKWMTRQDKAALPHDFTLVIQKKMENLNTRIAADTTLGQEYAVGHSYVTADKLIMNPRKWFLSVIETGLEPLLRKYWFDNASAIKDAVDELKAGIE